MAGCRACSCAAARARVSSRGDADGDHSRQRPELREKPPSEPTAAGWRLSANRVGRVKDRFGVTVVTAAPHGPHTCTTHEVEDALRSQMLKLSDLK